MKLLVIGAGGHGRELAAVVLACRSRGQVLEFEGFVDDAPSAALGPTTRPMSLLLGSEFRYLAGIGDPTVRRAVVRRIGTGAAASPPVIHPLAWLDPTSGLGVGSVLGPGAVVGPDVTLGAHVHLNAGATVAHDCVLADYATLCPGVHLAGNVTVDECAFLGIGSKVIQGCRVGAGSIVGAGAVVTTDVAPNTVVAGVPARPLRR